MTKNQREDYALQYTTQIAYFLCSQNMGVKDLYRACNLNDIPGKKDAEKFSNKFLIFRDYGVSKPTPEELFFAETCRIKREHEKRESGLLFFVGILAPLLSIVCVALIIVGTATYNLAIALPPVFVLFSIWYIASMALDRAGGNEMLLRDYTKYSKPPFDSIEDLKAACKKCHLDDTIQAIYDHLSSLSDKKTEGAELLSRGQAESRNASKLMAMFAHHHQGFFGWFIPWHIGTEAKGIPIIKSKYAEDIEKFLLLTSRKSPTSTCPVSAGDISLTPGSSSSNDHSNSPSQHNKKESTRNLNTKKVILVKSSRYTNPRK